jgi:glycosyltransferase involved in cell wall biosynthesis
MDPRVTVIIATYNRANVLRFAIESVLAQTFTDFELLVIGDGCTDDSETTVASFPDPRVRWINIPRAGNQWGPNNEGLRQARGELIAYLGHDDLWLPSHLEILIRALDAGADLAHSIVGSVYRDGSLEAMITGAPGEWIPPSCVMHRRDPVRAIGGWRDHRTIKVASEQDLWTRMHAAGLRFVSVPRLTIIKLPGTERPKVYIERPFHEQAAWTERIRKEPQLEATLLGEIVVKLHASARPARLLRRAWRLLLKPSQWFSFVFRTRGARVRAAQRYKGVPPVG